ncbi:MAG: shikimate kinase [Candidatus Omnitrophota bacterium]
MNNIYLVGFMGTGKSSVGRLLSKRTGRKFVDLDDLIEIKENKKISDIFVKNLEGYFRKIEKQTLIEISEKQEVIVACGGGIVIDPENIKVMKKTGKIICLMAKPEVILKRTERYSHRPLLKVDDPKKQIELLLEKRAPFYAMADITIDTSELKMQEVVEEVLKFVKQVD